MFFYEFGNHEAQISGDYEGVIDCLGLELDTEVKKEQYLEAKSKHWDYCVKNDLF